MDYFALALTAVGYVLLMLTNPARASFADGWRCLRRYPVIWRTLAGFALAHAVFLLAVRVASHLRGPPELIWMRPGWSDPTAWLRGTPDSIWWLPASDIRDFLGASLLPAVEFLAGLFNNVVSSFPIAAFVAIGLFVNRRGMSGVLFSALRRRFGWGVWLIFSLVLLAGVATLVKTVLYFRPSSVPDAWWPYAPSVAAVSALFEYLVGVAIQAYLILHAYAWVRGLSFDPAALRDVAIRRFGAAGKWAAGVMLVQAVFIELPLALAFVIQWPASPEVVASWLQLVRIALAAILLVFLSMQSWLVLHGETLRRAWSAHWRMIWRHLWPIAWFVIVAAFHCWVVHFLRLAILHGLGEETALGLTWSLVWPICAGLVGGWLLASWVCLFKQCE